MTPNSGGQVNGHDNNRPVGARLRDVSNGVVCGLAAFFLGTWLSHLQKRMLRADPDV